MDISAQLKQTEQLIAAGKHDEAKAVLRAVLAQDKRNAQAWYLVSQCVDDPKAKAESLRRALLADPSHAQAKHEFDAMNGLEVLRPPSLYSNAPTRRQAAWPWLVLGLAVLVILLLAGGLVFLSVGQKPTISPTLAPQSSATPDVNATATAVMQLTLKAAQLGQLANQQATYSSDADSSEATAFAMLHSQQTATAGAKGQK